MLPVSSKRSGDGRGGASILPLCVAAWLGALVGAAPAPAAAPACEDSRTVLPVAVELEWQAAPGRSGVDEAERWLGVLVDEFAVRPGMRIVSRSVRAADLLRAPPRASTPAVDAQADALLHVRIAPLAGRHGLSAELVSTPSSGKRRPVAPLRFVASAEGDEALRAAFAELAERVGAWICEPAGGVVLLANPEEGASSVLPAPPESGSESATSDDGAAQDAPPARDPLVVREVLVEGNRRIDADAIRAAINSQPGGPLSPAAIAGDVRRVFGLGFFSDVQVEQRPVEAGVALVFRVVEYPIVKRVTISGNENVKAEDIKSKLTLTVGSAIDHPLILENQQRVKAVYETKGYYLVKVSHEIREIGEGTAEVVYRVEEGEKIRLRRVEFEGNEALDDGDLLKVMETKPWGWLSFVTRLWDHSGLYAEPIFYQDLDRVTRRYMDEGFIRVEVGDPEVDIRKDGLFVTVKIEEGPQFRSGAVEVLGDESTDREALLSLVQTREGEVFSRTRLTDDVERLRAYYADRGFFDARVVPRTAVDEEKLHVSTAFAVEKGGLFFVDRIDVRGNTRTRDEVVRRELGISEGELYSGEAVRSSKARVRRLGFFEEVNIEAERTDKPGRVTLGVDVVERPTGSFSFGAGVGSTDGFLLSASISQDNLFGQGRAISASADLGGRSQSFHLRYLEPYAFGTSAALGGSVSMVSREFLDFDEEISGLSMNLTYPLDQGDTFVGTGYGFSVREVTGFETLRASSLLQREDFNGDTDTSLLSFSLRRDTRDDFRFPKTGQISGASIEWAGLGGLNRFVRLEAYTTHFLPAKRWLGFESTFVVNTRIGWVLPFNDVSDYDLPDCGGSLADPTSCASFLALSPEFAALSNIDDDLELTLTERYFLGGVGGLQLRGFKQRSVGPRRTELVAQSGFSNLGDRAFYPVGFDPATGACTSGTCNSLRDTDPDDFEDLDLAEVIGGNKMFLLNLELQFPIAEEMGLTGLVFFDTGNAFAENESMNPADFRLSTGAGVQWFSPFGPILVVLGFPLDRIEDEDAAVFEFSLGGAQY